MNTKATDLSIFNFHVSSDEDSGDIVFNLSLGIHSLKTYITGWSNCWKSISEKLEEYIFTGHSVVELDFDTEPTIISMTKEGEVTFLEIEPSHFTKEASFYGRCLEKDFLSKFYYGLLYSMTYRYDDIGCGWNWGDCKMVCYNQLKSRTVEEYLKTGILTKVESYVTKHILAIMDNEILHICDETIGYHIPINDKMEVFDKGGNVIVTLDGKVIQDGEYAKIADSLPSDFDLWDIRQIDDDMIEPQLILRKEVFDYSWQVFDKGDYEVTELGKDPYGFTSETLWAACDNLEMARVSHFLNINADTTYVLKWILRSNEGGTTDSVGNPTFDESELSIRMRDARKADIIERILSLRPMLPLKEDDLKACVYFYCPRCLRILLEHGANPNEQNIEEGYCPIAVRYRSVLSSTIWSIKSGEEKYGILKEMKACLESFGAKDVVIWNEEYPNIKIIKQKEYEGDNIRIK